MCKACQDRIAELEEELRQLKEAFAPTLDLPDSIPMQRGQRLILQALLARSIFSPTQYRAYVNGRPGRDDVRNLSVTVHRIRKVLDPYDIKIKTTPGVGYSMTPENKAKLRELLNRR